MLSVISYPLFALSVILSLVLSISLFPVDWFEYRPEWLGLMVFYWTFRAPAQFGVIMAWCLGLLLDILESTPLGDRKSTRLNSSHVRISYAVFCLKKKKK